MIKYNALVNLSDSLISDRVLGQLQSLARWVVVIAHVLPHGGLARRLRGTNGWIRHDSGVEGGHG